MIGTPPESYQSSRTEKPLNQEHRYGFRKCVEAVKAAVPVIDIADLLCGPGGLRRVNTHWFGRCPLPDHEDKIPSFVVYPNNNSWWCFGCSRGSDVLDLYQLAHGYVQKWEALIALALERGVELPKRPPKWHAWTGEKERRRKILVDVVAQSYRRRLFRLFKEDLESVSDPTEREEEARELWEGLWPLAWLCAQWRVNG